MRNKNGFPIAGTAQGFELACTGKLNGVSSKADEFIRSLKPYNGGNNKLWLLNELDIMDKHNAIVPVAAGQANMAFQIGLGGVFETPEGHVTIGGGPAGSRPLGFGEEFGIPDDAKVVELLEDGCELYRSRLRYLGFNVNAQMSIKVMLGKTRTTDAEPLIETLHSLIDFVEGTVDIVERRIL